MIRRSLRIGIRLGTLAGVAFALFKIVQARRPLPAVPQGEDPWAPIAPTSDPARAPVPRAVPEPPREEHGLVPPTVQPPTSLPRPSTRAEDPPFEPQSDAPPLVPPPALADDDEIIVLDSGDEILILESDPAEAVDAVSEAVAAAPALVPPSQAVPTDETQATEAPATEAPTTGARAAAPAKKAPAKKASTPKAPAKKAAARKATKKAVAAKAPAKKTAKKTAAKKSGSVAWVEPDGDVCPTTHPVKAKLRSGIFHLPGMAAYARTSPDRCYRDEQGVTADGLRKALR